MPAMPNREMFFKQMVATFLERTSPDSSMPKPAAIHMTSTPMIRNEKVLRMKDISETGASSARAKAGSAIMEPASSARRNFFMTFSPYYLFRFASVLKGLRTVFTGTDSYRLFNVRHKDLAVADASGAGFLLHSLDNGRHLFVINDQVNLDLGEEVNLVFRAAIKFRVPFLATKAAHFTDCHTADAQIRDCRFDIVQFERFDDTLNFLHHCLYLLSRVKNKKAP